MLHLQALELLLHFAQSLQLDNCCGVQRRWLADELSVAHLLAPLRQHERVDAKRFGNVLDQHPALVAQLHRPQLEVNAVSIDLLRSWCTH